MLVIILNVPRLMTPMMTDDTGDSTVEFKSVSTQTRVTFDTRRYRQFMKYEREFQPDKYKQSSSNDYPEPKGI